jgi:hypothetical protein
MCPAQPQQPQLPQQPQQAILYTFPYMAETITELNSEIYDRVLMYNRTFEDNFIYTSDHDAAQENDDNKVFLIRLTNPVTNKTLVVNVGGPHREYQENAIYAPTWILDALDIHDGPGEIFWEKVNEPPPRATKIVLKPLDTMMKHIDGRQEIEEHLKNFNVLQMGTTIPIPLRPFDNHITYVFVEKIEPEAVVLLRNEVELDLLDSIIEDEPQPQPQPQPPPQPIQRPPTPIPREPEIFSLPFNLPLVEPPTNTIQQPDPITRRHIIAAAAEKRRLAVLQDDSNL